MKSIAVGCHRLPFGALRREWVDRNECQLAPAVGDVSITPSAAVRRRRRERLLIPRTSRGRHQGGAQRRCTATQVVAALRSRWAERVVLLADTVSVTSAQACSRQLAEERFSEISSKRPAKRAALPFDDVVYLEEFWLTRKLDSGVGQ